MNKPIYLDALLGVLGIIVSLAIFFAQGGGGSVIANLVPIIPVLLALALIGSHRLLLYIKKMKGALALILNARSKSIMVIHIENANGDVWVEKKFRVDAMNGGSELSITKNETLCSEVQMLGMPPLATVTSASNPKSSLRPKYFHSSETDVGGVKHYKYEWRYEILPSIKGKGGFVEFFYETRIPKCEASAFTAAGGKLFYDHSAFDMEAEVTLIAPTSYEIEILSTYVEHFDGTQSACSVPPKLQAGNHVLNWNPPYVKGARSICDYRLIPTKTHVSTNVSSPKAAQAV